MAFLLKDGLIVNEDFSFEADVLIDKGIIKLIGKKLEINNDTTIIDAAGKLIMPGGIDTGTRLNYQDSVDDFFSGTKAAVAGGTTLILNCVETHSESLVEAFDKNYTLAKADACCDFGLQIEVKVLGDKTEEEMRTLTSRGINSFRISLEGNLTDEDLLKLFSVCRKLGVLPLIHAENGNIIKYNENKILGSGITGPEGHLYSRPEEVEAEATNRAIVLAKSCNTPVFIANITSKLAAKVIAEKREQGCQVFGQPLVAALAVDGNNYLNVNWSHAAAYVVSPPLRLDPATQTHLLHMLSSGSLYASGSDHCTYSKAQKLVGFNDFTKIPKGINGVEARMSIIWDRGVACNLMNINRYVAVTSANAAKIFNIYPRKGRIAVGSDADIVVWNPDKSIRISSETHKFASDFNVFEGIEVRGQPDYVFTNGKLVVENGNISVNRGAGKFIPTAPFSPHIFSQFQIENALHPVSRPASKSEDPKESEVPRKESPKEFHARPQTRAGGRNLQDSTFSLSGKQIDEKKAKTTGVKSNPAGNPSTRLW